MEQKNTKRSYRLFVGVDIAYQDFTASLVQGAKTMREPHPYSQTTPGFERFQKRLQESGVPPSDTLVVMEATGSYWVALATTLSHAGFAVSVMNPMQAHRAGQSATQTGEERCLRCTNDCGTSSSTGASLLDTASSHLLRTPAALSATSKFA